MQAFEETVSFGIESQIFTLDRKSASFLFTWHFHEAYEITLITAGWGRRFVGNSISNYAAGDLVIIPPGVPHTWQTAQESTDNEAVVIQFDKKMPLDFSGVVDFREIRQLLSQASVIISGISADFIQRMKEFHLSSGIDRLIKFLEILQSLNNFERTVLCDDFYVLSPDKEVSKKLDAVIKYLDNLSGEVPSVPQLATELGMSESTFRRFMIKYAGKSLITFYNEMRISKACKLLLETKLSILEISLNSGFHNLSHFNQTFKKIKNLSPKQYRQSLKSNSV